MKNSRSTWNYDLCCFYLWPKDPLVSPKLYHLDFGKDSCPLRERFILKTKSHSERHLPGNKITTRGQIHVSSNNLSSLLYLRSCSGWDGCSSFPIRMFIQNVNCYVHIFHTFYHIFQELKEQSPKSISDVWFEIFCSLFCFQFWFERRFEYNF